MRAEVFSFLPDFHTNTSKEIQSNTSLYKAAQLIINSKRAEGYYPSYYHE
jgi:hypothetical protein